MIQTIKEINNRIDSINQNICIIKARLKKIIKEGNYETINQKK